MTDEEKRRWKWDQQWLKMALHASSMSKDPEKQVGAVIVGEDNIRMSDGYNGFPRGVADTPARLNDKFLKRLLMVHAERNALLNAVRLGGRSLKGSTLYFVAYDESGLHGGSPCTACTLELIQAGVSHVVTYPPKLVSSWAGDIQFAHGLLEEVGITYREVPVFQDLKSIRE